MNQRSFLGHAVVYGAANLLTQAAGLEVRAIPFTPEWLSAAQTQSLAAAAQIMAGRIAPVPYDVELCRLCDFRDVCRYDARSGTAAAESA